MNLIGYVPWLNVDLGGFEEVNANAGTYVVFTIVGIGRCFGLHSLPKLVSCREMEEMYGDVRGNGHIGARVVGTLSIDLIPFTPHHAGCIHHSHHGFPDAISSVFAVNSVRLLCTGLRSVGLVLLSRHDTYVNVAFELGEKVVTELHVNIFSFCMVATYMTISVPKNPPNTTNVTSSQAIVLWEQLESVEAYSLRLNRVEVYRGLDTSAVISNLEPNMTYFVGVAGVASWGTDGRVGLYQTSRRSKCRMGDLAI